MDVFLFPGRSARYPEMISRVIEAWPIGAEIVSLASRVLGRDLHRQYRSDNRGIFASERDIQVGVFLATHLHLRALEANDVHAEMSMGFGIGEYNHLVHIGALDFDEALRLVDTRAIAFGSSPRGAMTLVCGIAAEAIERAMSVVRTRGVVESGVHVSPDQHVISGTLEAVDAAVDEAQRRDRTVSMKRLHREIAAYSSLMTDAGAQMRPALAQAKWKLASHFYMPNVLGSPVLAYAPEMFVDFLSRQVYSPVRWKESIEYLASRDAEAVFVEVGPRSVLFDLIPSNWISNRFVRTDRPGNLAESMIRTARELSR